MADMGTKYGSKRFDPQCPKDALGEAGRQLVLDAALKHHTNGEIPNGDYLTHFMGGVLTGLAQATAAHLNGTEESWASIRASLLELTPWAVDQARSAQGLEPLKDT